MPIATPQITYLDDKEAERIDARRARDLAFSDFAPVREPPNTHHQPQRPSWYVLAKTGEYVTCRNRLAERHLRALDFSATVTNVCAEPFAAHRSAKTSKSRTPDFLVQRVDAPLQVIDVMSARRQTQKAARQHVLLMEAVCEQAGWDYQLCGEFNDAFSANLSWLAGFRRPMDAAPFVAAILERLEQPGTVQDVVEECGPPLLVRPVLFHLIWHHQLSCDLSTPLSDETLLEVAH